MTRVFPRLFRARFWSLALKELRQIRRDRRLMISLLVPPTLQILLFGFALDPEVQNLRLGILDESRTAESRELVSAITENQTFRLTGSYSTSAALEQAIRSGRLDVGVVVPYDFARLRARDRSATVQILVNAVNANTAQIAEGYIEGAIVWFNQRVRASPPSSDRPRPAVQMRAAYLYNPGLVSAWFTVTGVLGMLIILNGSIVAGATMIKEKERGTVEQLLMTPASALEVVAAKMVPLFILLMGMTALALIVAHLAFRVPFRGSFLLVLAACACCVLTGIAIGTFISTVARSANQAQLMMFFVNPPLTSLSGAFTPVEAMPRWAQPLPVFNPIAHFATMTRAVLLKGVGLDVVYPHLLALIAIACVLVSVSAWRFRKQLS